MKNLLSTLLLIIMPFSVNAQLKETLNQELNQDLINFKKTKRVGCIMFAAGIPVIIIGLNMIDNSPEECDPGAPGRDCHYTEVKGIGVLLAGLTLSGIGSGIWAVAKRNEYIYKYRHYSLVASASLNGIRLKINF